MKFNGQPFVGYLQLTSGSPGPTAIPIYVNGKATVYTLQSSDAMIITSLSISSNDTAFPLCTIDSGVGGTMHILGSYYVGIGASSAPSTISDFIGLQPGIIGTKGVAIRAGAAPGITAGKTIEVVIRGIISQS